MVSRQFSQRNLAVKCNVPTVQPDANQKNRLSQIDTNDFYRIHDGVPLKNNTQHQCCRVCTERGASITALQGIDVWQPALLTNLWMNVIHHVHIEQLTDKPHHTDRPRRTSNYPKYVSFLSSYKKFIL